MKKVIFSLALLLTSSLLGFAQKGISYQAIILDPKPIEIPGQDITGQPFVNGDVSLKFKLFSSTFVQEFEEVHATQTDAYGMVNVLIGSQNAAAFSALVWDSNPRNMQVWVSFDQGGNYTKVSEQVLTYNPMALFAVTAGKLSETLSIAGGGTAATTAAAARTNLGLGNVDNTSDANKPISIATQLALDAKTNALTSYVNNQVAAATIADADATTKGKIQLAGDLGGTAAAPSVPGLAVKADAAAVAASLGLKEDVSNKANTPLGTSTTLYPTQNAVKTYVDAQVAGATIVDADASTKGKIQLAGDLAGTASLPTVPGLAAKADAAAVNTALNLKANTADMTVALSNKESIDNKSISVVADGGSDTRYPTVKSVKTYVDTQVAGATIADADGSTKGKIQLAGDLAGTAASPTVPGLVAKADAAAVTTALAQKAPLASPAFTGTVAVGTASPSPSAVLDLTSTSQGLLLPRLTFVQKSAIVSPEAGLILWCTDCGANGELQVYNGTNFVNMVGANAQFALPTLSATSAATAITSSSFTTGGSIESDGGAFVTARGVVWNTSTNPTISLSTKTSDGTGIGNFSSSVTGLTSGVTYYVRAYATNSVGTKYGPEITVNSAQAVATLATTTAASSITATSASSGGNITYNGGATVTASGVVWSTSASPTVALSTKTTDGTANGTFSSSITGLSPGTLYYVRSYAINSAGTSYGAQTSFTTLTTPTLAGTTAASSIASTTAISGGNILSDGGSTITARGIVWGTATNPTTSLTTKTTDGTQTGIYTSAISGLSPGTLYYVKSYATNAIGTSYGAEISFTTLTTPTLAGTTAASSIASTTATSGGNISTDGGSAVTARGIVWGTTPNPTTDLTTKTTDGTGTGAFTSSLTGLSPATTYYVRSYAINAIGTSYGAEISFTTLAVTPTQAAITTQPSGAVNGVALTTQPVIRITDASGNLDTSSTVNVVASIASGTGTLSGTTTVAAVNGVATFTNLVLSGTAGNFTLTFTPTSLTAATSSSFALSVGAATQAAITTQPSGAVNGVALTTQPVVRITDSSGNTVTTSTVNVVASIASGTGTLSGTTTVAAVNGIATFTDLVLSGTAGNFTLAFTPTSLTAATSSSFALSFGAATQAAITTQPSGAVAGVALTTQPVVRITDASGNTVTSSTVNVVASIASGTGTLSGTTTVSAVNGVATFTDLVLSGTAGNFTLTFTPASLAAATSSSFALGVGAATQAAITTQPAGAVAGVALTTQPVIRITDASGNTDTSSTVNVVASIASGTGILSGTTTVAAVNGVATFTNLALSGTAGNFTLTFTPTSLTAATSSSFALSVGAATQAAITTQPAGAVAGVAFTTQPVIRVTDASGNTVTSSTVNVVASIASGTGTLSGTTNVAAVNGVATFTDLVLSGTAENFTLAFTPTSLTATTSSSFALSFGSATQAAITTQPSGAVAGVALTTQPVVRITDASGNTVTSSTVNVVASVASGTATLSGTTTVAAVNGVASFTNLALSGTAGNFTLTFTPTSLTAATSSSFALGVGAATQAAITTQPSGAVNGVALTTQPVIRITDSSGNTVTSSTVSVVASIASGTGTLSGTTTVPAVNGVATFTNLVITGTTGSYTLTFTPTSLTAATSSSFALSVGAATQAAITTQPAGAVAGVAFTTQPVIRITDTSGNTDTSSTVNVVASIASGTGTLSGTTTVAAVNGVATFTDLVLTGTAGNFTLAFTPTSLTVATSSSFALGVGAATQAAITTQPSGAVNGVALTTQPVIRITDASGNTITSSTVNVVASIASGTGTLSGTTTVAAVNGVASFTNLVLSGTAGNFTLTFTPTSLTAATSSSFALSVGAAAQAAITNQPTGAVNGVALTTQPVVRITDSSGNTVTSSTINVVASIASGTGTLSGTTTVAAVNGVATFTNLVLSGTAGNFTLRFTPTSLTATTSSSFALGVGAATQAAITNQPSGAVNGVALTTQPVVRITDSSGNTVTSTTVSVVASIASGTGTLSGTTTVAAINGVATFTNLVITGTTGSYTLTFTPTSLTAATSSSFALTAGAASKAMITTDLAGAVNGSAFTTQPVVRITDASGNAVTTSTVNVVASIASGTGTLSGTTTVAAVAGVATFTNLVITGTTGSYTLTFTPTSLTAATSSSFALTAGAASKAMITTGPAGAVNGSAFTTQPVVRITDASGNTVTSSTVNVVASIASGTGTLSGTTTVAAVNGVATFTNLVLSGTAGNFTLSFTPTSLTAATSSSFALIAGAASKAMITTDPAGAVNGSAFTTQPVVRITDASDNTVTSSTVNVVASIASGTGTLSGSTTVAAVNGVATFTNLVITGTTGSYTLTFTPTSLTAATSSSFALTAGAASKAMITTGPSGAAAGVAFTTQPVIRITDASGNTVTTSTASVVASIASGTGTLSGTTTVAAVAGVATFTNLVLSGTTGNFTLTFTPASLTAASSSSFTLTTGAASKAMITTQPSGAVNGAALTTQPVIRVTDASENTVTSSTVSVVASIASGSGTLSGTTTVAAVNGVATFTDLVLSGTPGNFTLRFTPTSLTAATSSSFVLSVGAASKVMITTQPAGAFTGTAFSTQPVVKITDAGGNTITSSTANVVASIASGAGTLSGTTTVAAVNGVATFTNLKITGTGNHTLTFTAAGGLTAATSNTVTVAALGCAQGGTCAVGETGPGGGTVFYYSAAGFNCGPNFTDRCNYLEVAPNTWNGGTADPILRWDPTGGDDNLVGYPDLVTDSYPAVTAHINESEIGLGYKSSVYLVNYYISRTSDPYAAGAARGYTGGGKTDWYLGTSVEMNLLADWSKGNAATPTVDSSSGTLIRGGFLTGGEFYWTASQLDWAKENAYKQDFSSNGSGGSNQDHKYARSRAVRPIRAF